MAYKSIGDPPAHAEVLPDPQRYTVKRGQTCAIGTIAGGEKKVGSAEDTARGYDTALDRADQTIATGWSRRASVWAQAHTDAAWIGQIPSFTPMSADVI